MDSSSEPEPDSAASSMVPLQAVLVIRENARAWTIAGRDRQGRPKMKPALPKVRLPRGTRLQIEMAHQESRQDAGDGLVHAQGGLYLSVSAVLDGQVSPQVVGSFVLKNDIADIAPGRWVTTLARTNPQIMKGRDAKGKPFFEPTPLAGRIQVPAGERLRVSTIHSESEKDPGDGTILSSGLQPYLLILECPGEPRAAGLFVEKQAVADAPPA